MCFYINEYIIYYNETSPTCACLCVFSYVVDASEVQTPTLCRLVMFYADDVLCHALHDIAVNEIYYFYLFTHIITCVCYIIICFGIGNLTSCFGNFYRWPCFIHPQVGSPTIYRTGMVPPGSQ